MEIYDRLDRQYQMYSDEYKEAALRVLDSGWYVLGQEVIKFEKNFAERMNSKYCVGLNSGLDALILAVRALEIGAGDEVIVPANTFIATVLAVTANGATPIFVEPDEYYNIDADKIEKAITKRTKAVVAVHLYGQAANMENIKRIVDAYKLYLIEDCAQAHTATFDEKIIGTWGDIGCFSFYPTKNLGAFGDSGAIITDNVELADRIRTIRNYGSKMKYHNEICGVNSRMDEIQAALLNVKLSHLDELVTERRKIAALYLKGIRNSQIILPSVREGSTHVWHLFVVRCEYRDRLKFFLEGKGIHTQIHYPVPPHLQECYSECDFYNKGLPITEAYAKTVLSLPLYNGMTTDEIAYVISALNEFRV